MPFIERVSAFLLAKLSFRQQLTYTFTLGIILLALITSFVTARTSLKTIEISMIDEGHEIALNLARHSTLALLYHSKEAAKEAADNSLGFPDIVGASLFTTDYKPLLLAGTPLISKEISVFVSADGISTRENDQFWDFSIPVYSGSAIDPETNSPFTTDKTTREHIGYVHIIKSKLNLDAMSRDILLTNLLTSTLLSLILLALLLLLTNRVTRPIKSLSHRMQKAELGNYDIRAELEGPSDIINMEQAFNTMMDELQARQQELERARDSALASALLKGQFVASVSHELRTPMNSILGMMELIANQGVQLKTQHYLKIARSSGEQLLRLINDILDFSKLESAKMQLHVESVNIAKLVQDVIDLLSVQVKGKHLLLGADIDPRLPLTVQADPGRVSQILINLIGNAIKFTEYGCLSIHVTVLEGDKQNIQLKFEVMDTGIGIKKSQQRAIFQAFTQADSSTTRLYGGTGLGLAISRQLVGLMGGEMGVESKIDSGSNFWMTLPLGCDPNIGQGAQQNSSHARAKILVLKSDANVPTIHEKLTALGYELTLVNNMVQALDKLSPVTDNLPAYSLFIIYSADVPHDEPETVLNNLAVNEQPQTIIMTPQWQQCQPQQPKQYYLPLKLSDKQLYAVIASLLSRSPSDMLISNGRIEELEPDTSLKIEHSKGDVLVVEDNKSNQYVAIAMLEKLGYLHIIASNGQEALQFLPDPNIKMIFMDCHMPIMDGYEATQKIRQGELNGEHIPIIAMTADVSDSDKTYCLKIGMDDFLAKPISVASLKLKLDKWDKSVTNNEESSLKSHNETTKNTVLMTNPLDAQSECVDQSVMEHLREQTGKTFILLVRAYLEDTPQSITQLQQAIEQQDIKKIRDLSHLIKGSSATLGANRLAEISNTLQISANEETQAIHLNLLHQLKQDFIQVTAYLDDEISKLNHKKYPDMPKATHSQKVKSELPYLLIVDDDRSTRLSLRGCLEQDNYYIEEASNGEIALKHCEQNMPDLILMDAMMDEMNGFDAMSLILKLPTPFKPPILMLTASNDEAIINMAFEHGATDFIPKPVNLHVLKKRVAHLIRATQAERDIHQLAYHDPLTNLPNRTQFMEKFTEGLNRSKSNKTMLALMFIDLDKFKFINDTQGHDVGDMLLKAVAKRITHCVRTDDLVVRLGGDEFTILLEDIKTSAIAAKVANKVCKLLSEPFTFQNKAVSAPASVGIAVFPSDGQDINTLMKHADTAMYRAKSRGGDQFQFYEYGMEAELVRRIELEHDLGKAIDNDELILHYQPQIELNSGKLIGVEALVRWNHPERGLMPPDEFIPLAEESGLILDLGEWVLNESCQQMKQWLNSGLNIEFIAVNLSGKQMQETDLLAHIKNCLNLHELPAQYIQLEMTESIMAVESEACLELLNGLKELGISVAIDDFGTGYSSLSYLTKFPVDTLKIDYSFITNLPDDNDSATVTSGIIALAHKLRMNVIAEGVETLAQREFLQHELCDAIQGYSISRPLPAKEFEDWIKSYEPVTASK